MRKPTYRTLTLLSAVALNACQTMPPAPPPEPPKPRPQIQQPAQPSEDLSPSERVRRALHALQVGDQETARQQLQWALDAKPSQPVARKLMEQLDRDPQEYLGSESFTYRVRPGDSLSGIAKTYLGDPLKFVILARYNDITNPSRLKAGQALRIPGTRPAASEPAPAVAEGVSAPPEEETAPSAAPEEPMPAITEPRSTEPGPATLEPVVEPTLEPETRVTEPAAPTLEPIPVEELLASAKTLYDTADYRQAIMVLEDADAGTAEGQDEGLRALLIAAYAAYTDQLIASGELSAARFTLEKAIALDPSNEAFSSKLAFVEDKLEAQRLYARGKSLMDDSKLEAAYDTFSQALVYDPENTAVNQALDTLKPQLVEQYHRKAMQLFRRQKLDEAISYWDKVLAIDPNHSLAPGYRARALELKKRLEKIESQ